MIINFDSIGTKAIPNFKGGEKALNTAMYSDDNIKIMRAYLEPGASIGLHTHDTSLEVIFITKGVATFIYNGQEEIAKAGECHYCPKGQNHTFINKSDENVEFYAVVPEVK